MISHLSQNSRWPPEVKGPKQPNWTPQSIFRLDIWISFIRFGQNLAWTYFLTLQPSLSKNLSVSAKSKVATRGQRSKMDQIWPHKSHFGSAFRSRLLDLDKIWYKHTSLLLTLQPSLRRNLSFTKIKDGGITKNTKSDLFARRYTSMGAIKLRIISYWLRREGGCLAPHPC